MHFHCYHLSTHDIACRQLHPLLNIIIMSHHTVFVTFDPTTYIVTEGVNAFAQLILVRSGDLSGSTTVTVTPQSGTAIGIQYIIQIKCNCHNGFYVQLLLSVILF